METEADNNVSWIDALYTYFENLFKLEDQKAFVIANMIEKLRHMDKAMNKFCDRVEAGEVKSVKTYAEFCEILGRENKFEEQMIMDIEPKNQLPLQKGQ